MEKRVFSRLEATYPARIEAKDKDQNVCFKTTGEVLDLSENGIQLKTFERIPARPLVFIEIDLSRHPKLSQLSTEGQIVWSHLDLKTGKFRYGIFCNPDEQMHYSKVIRKLVPQNKNDHFLFKLEVFLKDTNLFGNTYFSRYFEWQGMAREAYFETLPNYRELLTLGIKLITKRASIEYKHECTAFDHIHIKIQNRNIHKCSFDMVFYYTSEKTHEIIAEGEQTLTFADPHGKIMRIPQPILDIIVTHPAERTKI